MFLRNAALAHPKPRSRSRSRQVIAVLILAITSVSLGCSVKLIGDYDDTIDKGITELQQRSELYFAKLKSSPNTAFDQDFYNDTDSRLAVLKTRASSLPKNTILVEQITNLTSQFEKFQELDRSSQRPISIGIVKSGESAIAVSVESILRLELALKRGIATPPALAAK